MANIYSGSASGSAPTQIDVDTVSKEVVTENYNRVGLALCNLSDGTIYVAFGISSAVVGSGLVILPFGGSFLMTEYSYTKEAVTAIAHSDNSLLAIQEFVIRS